jgi:multimeric flavodoxin WrbA
VAAHGVMMHHPGELVSGIIPPQVEMDRLVCADGANPEPTRTEGKNAALAKRIELEGWSYEQQLKGRPFSVVVHGDVEGAENIRRSIADWLRAIGLQCAGAAGELDRYIGYWKPYATSHAELDADHAIQQEVRDAAVTLKEAVLAQPSGTLTAADRDLKPPRQK